MGENQLLVLAVLKGSNSTRHSNINFYCGDHLKVLVCTEPPLLPRTLLVVRVLCLWLPRSQPTEQPRAEAPGKFSHHPQRPSLGLALFFLRFGHCMLQKMRNLWRRDRTPQWLTGMAAVGWEVRPKCWAETRAHAGTRSWSFCPHGSGTAQRRTDPPTATDEEWT